MMHINSLTLAKFNKNTTIVTPLGKYCMVHLLPSLTNLNLTLPGASLGRHLLFCTLLGHQRSVLLVPNHTNDGQWYSGYVL